MRRRCSFYPALLLTAAVLASGCQHRSGPPYSPEQAIETFRLAEGFRIELAAAEPDVQDPVAIAFDPDGRLFVVEMPEYPMERAARGESGCLRTPTTMAGSSGAPCSPTGCTSRPA